MPRQPGIFARDGVGPGSVRVEVWEARWTPGREDETRVAGRVQVFDCREPEMHNSGVVDHNPHLVDVEYDPKEGFERWFEVREHFGRREEREW